MSWAPPGLLAFLAPDRTEFHLQALTALIAAARVKNEEVEVYQGLRLGIELACRNVDARILAKVSWQGVNFPSVSLPGHDFSGFDFRDARMENANFRGTIFNGSEFGGAKLQGAQLQGASLRRANLMHCDLAGANLTDAFLNKATLTGVKVLDADLGGADLTDHPIDVLQVPWNLAKNWQLAKFDPDVRAGLDVKFST